jgi:hypothetical protein
MSEYIFAQKSLRSPYGREHITIAYHLLLIDGSYEQPCAAAIYVYDQSIAVLII